MDEAARKLRRDLERRFARSISLPVFAIRIAGSAFFRRSILGFGMFLISFSIVFTILQSEYGPGADYMVVQKTEHGYRSFYLAIGRTGVLGFHFETTTVDDVPGNYWLHVARPGLKLDNIFPPMIGVMWHNWAHKFELRAYTNFMALILMGLALMWLARRLDRWEQSKLRPGGFPVLFTKPPSSVDDPKWRIVDDSSSEERRKGVGCRPPFS